MPKPRDGLRIMLGDGSRMPIIPIQGDMFWSMTQASSQASKGNLSLGKAIGSMPTPIVNSFCHHQLKERDEGRGARDDGQKETDGA
jgi:hypothetical protein